ncbi:MAG: Gfo/Idh/MocA family oxidoreductase [Prevotella sp.]|nr:Gfo/Idh/MocA family oxidoreductase [Prevotella sp.]
MTVFPHTIRIAFIGLGDRGRKALRLMLPLEGIEVTALCDLSEAHIQETKELMATESVTGISDWKQILCVSGKEAYKVVCQKEDVDLVYICSDWGSHAPIALEAMRHGKHVAVEVPAAMIMEDIRLLIATAEQADRQCFMLENTCFEHQIIEAIEAIHRGDIGEVVHAEGCYYHHLGNRWSPWRLDINRQQRGDLYPTHELGPICQALGIGVEDRLQTLVSMDTPALTGPQTYEALMGEAAADFQNGDHTTTLIRTLRGRTILLKHDVLTEQPYERQFTFIGTRGRIELHDTGRSSHDVMTQSMNQHLIDSLRNGLPLSISIYDMATWCAAIPLSCESIARGFAPVQFPDFYTK